MKLELLSIDQFSDKIGQTFTVEEEGLPPIEMKLAEVTPLKNYANATREPFSLVFTTSGIGLLQQRTYHLHHASLGQKPFFLVPVGKKDDIISYQSIFN